MRLSKRSILSGTGQFEIACLGKRSLGLKYATSKFTVKSLKYTRSELGTDVVVSFVENWTGLTVERVH